VIWEGFLNIFTLESILLIVTGVIIGVTFGCIPGLSANMAVTLCLPLSFVLEPVPGIALLVSLYLGGISGGLISAILLKIPGTPASIATCFDGGPMADKGEAGKALSAGIIFSFLGGLVSILLLIFVSPTLAKLALKFGPFEYCAVAIFSLTLVSGLVGKDFTKGIIGAFIGVMLSTIGAAPIDGAPRFTLGNRDLQGGLNVIALMIGLFAVAEVIKIAEDSVIRQTAVKPINFKITGFGLSLKEIWGQKFNAIRSALIGTAIGILPGLGGSTANIISYSVAKNQSKHSEDFGTGILDGIVASETSNNATVGGALIPLLTLGIPGDVTTAILLGAMTIHGISTGPLMFKTNGVLVYSVFAALLLANVVMLIVMYSGLRGFVRLLSVPKRYLLPIVMVFCLVGAFAINNRMFDVWCVLVFGVLGYLLNKAEIPFAPVVMGFILAPIVELYLRRAAMLTEGDMSGFFTRPIACGFSVFTLLFVAWQIVKIVHSKRKVKA